MGTYATAQTIYFQEDLEGGLPAEWVVANDDGGWAVGDAAAVSSAYFNVPDIGEGQMACFNDDGLGGDHAGGGTLTTGTIDLSGVTGDVILEMHNYFLDADYQGADEVAMVNASTDGGATWTEVVNFGASGGYVVYFADFSAYAGEMVQLQFSYDDGDGWNFGWAIDNITISDQVTLIPQREFSVNAGPAAMMNQVADGIDYNHQGWIFNNGFETITSYDLEYSNGTDDFSIPVTGVNIEFGGFAKYVADQAIVTSGDQMWTVTISNVNGSMEADEDTSDNSDSFNLNVVSGLNPDKGVLVEEATGTWCPWCTRGTTFLDEMAARFPDNFAGVAVHNADPMVVTAYDSQISSMVGGYPSTIIGRDAEVDPGNIVAPCLTAMQEAPVASLVVGAELSGTTLTTSLEVTFLEAVTAADYSLLIVPTEDNLTGEGGDWSQANAYAGGANGEMGGYELLPGSIPGLDYDHVAMGLIGGFDGVADDITGNFAVGGSDAYIFDSWTIPAGSNMDNMHLVGILLDSDGTVVNVVSSSIDDAVAEGLSLVSVEEIENVTFSKIYPNPVADNAFVSLNILQPSDVVITLSNALGQVVESVDFGTLSGTNQLELNMSTYTAGLYTVTVQVGEDSFTQKITK